MSEDKFILTTDYKYGMFSAVFSFEGSEDTIKKMDKTDLLHSYMVSKIMICFEEMLKDSQLFEDDPFLQNAMKQVGSVVSSVKKKTSIGFDKRLQLTLEMVEERYPFETECIRELIRDKSGLVCLSFFLPQIVGNLVQEYDGDKEDKLAHLVGVNLSQFVSAMGHSSESAIADAVNLWREMEIENKISDTKAVARMADIIRQTVQVALIASGDFDRFVTLQQKLKQNEADEDPI